MQTRHARRSDLLGYVIQGGARKFEMKAVHRFAKERPGVAVEVSYMDASPRGEQRTPDLSVEPEIVRRMIP